MAREIETEHHILGGHLPVIVVGRIQPSVLRALLAYNPETGELTWLPRGGEFFKNTSQSPEHNAAAWNAKFAGKPALIANGGDGYKGGSIFNRKYIAHRVAWAIYYGEWPVGHVDHINHNRTDNRISNLRVVTRVENMRNAKIRQDNSSGVTGVCWDAARGKWRAEINGVRRTMLGRFDSLDDAVAARKAAERLHGYHENHGTLCEGAAT